MSSVFILFSLFATAVFDIRPFAFSFRVPWGGFFFPFSFFFLSDGGILGLAFGVLSAGHGGIMVLFFSLSVFFFGIGSGACGVVGLRSTVHSFGPEHYYYSLFLLLFLLLPP